MSNSAMMSLLGSGAPQVKTTSKTQGVKQPTAEEAALFGALLGSMAKSDPAKTSLPQWSGQTLKLMEASGKKMPLVGLGAKPPDGRTSGKKPADLKVLNAAAAAELKAGTEDQKTAAKGNVPASASVKESSKINAAGQPGSLQEKRSAVEAKATESHQQSLSKAEAGQIKAGETEKFNLQQAEGSTASGETDAAAAVKVARSGEKLQVQVEKAALQAGAARNEKTAELEKPAMADGMKSRTGEDPLLKGVAVKSAAKAVKAEGQTGQKAPAVAARETQSSDPHAAARTFHHQMNKATAGEKGNSEAAGVQSKDRNGETLTAQASAQSVKNSAQSTVQQTAKLAGAEPVVLRDAVIEQVRPVVTRMIRQSESKVTLALKPESLGQVRIEVESVKGLTEVRFMVESTEVKTLMDQSLPELKMALNREGLESGSLNVEVNQDFASQQKGEGRQPQQGHGGQQPAGHSGGQQREADTGQPRQERRFGYNSMELEA